MSVLGDRIRAMKLPPIRSTAELEDPLALAKVFNPCGCQTWWIVEFDGEDECFGAVDLGMMYGAPELGSFSLAELEAVRTPPFGLPLEVDEHFRPVRLSALRSPSKPTAGS